MAITDRIQVVDADSHVSEPYDLWTSRVSTKKWGENVPHVIPDPREPREEGRPVNDVWVFGDEVVMEAGKLAMAGHKEYFPSHPRTLADGHPAAYDARERIKYLDAEGLHAQVLYPNVGGFGAGRFLKLGEPALMLECVRAYNDFMHDWCSIAPNRLIPIMSLPFWDLQESIDEARRCAKLGHKGILFGSHTHTFGQPFLADPYWDPVWAVAQDLELSINFHIGAASDEAKGARRPPGFPAAALGARNAVTSFFDNAVAITDVILSGICVRFPRLNFVSVESGVGWVPFLLDLLDWNWTNMGAHRAFADKSLLPSDIFRRQVYACFWFERETVFNALERIPDNLLYETDFPHPVSMSPDGPPDVGGHPRDYIESTLGHLPDEQLRKLLHDNAAVIYHLD